MSTDTWAIAETEPRADACEMLLKHYPAPDLWSIKKIGETYGIPVRSLTRASKRLQKKGLLVLRSRREAAILHHEKHMNASQRQWARKKREKREARGRVR